MPDNDLTVGELDELAKLEREATARTSQRWVSTTDRDDGTAQVYSPSRGLCRVIVPVAETSAEDAPFIAALRNAAPSLLAMSRRTILAESELKAAREEIARLRASLEKADALIDEYETTDSSKGDAK